MITSCCTVILYINHNILCFVAKSSHWQPLRCMSLGQRVIETLQHFKVGLGWWWSLLYHSALLSGLYLLHWLREEGHMPSKWTHKMNFKTLRSECGQCPFSCIFFNHHETGSSWQTVCSIRPWPHAPLCYLPVHIAPTVTPGRCRRTVVKNLRFSFMHFHSSSGPDQQIVL